MPYGLVKCTYCGSLQSFEFANVKSLDNRSYKCNNCSVYSGNNYYKQSQYTNFKLVVEYDPTFIIEKIVAPVKNPTIMSFLAKNNFINCGTHCHNTIYSSSDGCKILFVEPYNRKTQEVKIIAPAGNTLLKELKNAASSDRKLIKLLTPPKPKLPTSQRDAVGEEVFVGDWVAYSAIHNSGLQVGEIVTINAKTVSIKPLRNNRITSGKSLNQIIKISHERAMLYKFENS